MKNTKLLFTDLDGTLLNDEKKVTPKNREAIEQMLAKGHKLIIATGRATKSAIYIAKQLDLDKEGCFLISFNGAVITKGGTHETIYEKAIEKEVLYSLVHDAAEKDLYIQTYFDGKVAASKDNDVFKLYLYKTHMEGFTFDDIERTEIAQVPKILVSTPDIPVLTEFEQAHKELEKTKVTSVYSQPDYLEYGPHNISKGSAILYLCDYLGISVENTIAAGDASNDIKMLETAYVGAAMQNASKEAKDAANYITEKNNNEDGFAEIVEKFVL